MGNIEIVHDHSFNTASAETLLKDFEDTVKDKVFVAAYALEKKMPEIIPPVGYSGWRLNCFDTYDIEQQFRESQSTLEIRNDTSHYDFQIGKKALSDVSEISDIGEWENFIKVILDHTYSTTPDSTRLYHFRKMVYENLIEPFNLKKTVYYSQDSFNTDIFLQSGIHHTIEELKNNQNLVIIELDKKPVEFEDLTRLSTTIFIDEYKDFKK